MDALLGVVFVAQLKSQQPGVVALHPSPHDAKREAEQAASAEGSPQSSPRSPPLEERVRITECFGIPAKIFAKLMLPDEDLCNRPFYMGLDAGLREAGLAPQRQKAGNSAEEGAGSNQLIFVSFPCNVSEFRDPEGGPLQKDRDWRNPLDEREKVQRFNVVHVLDARRTSRLEKHTNCIWQVSCDLARALVNEEERVGYLSKEIRRLAGKEHDLTQDQPLDSRRLMDKRVKRTLEGLLADMYEGVHRSGYRSLRVNNNTLCLVCVFPKQEEPAPPAADQALVLTCAREEVLEELPKDSADVVRCITGNVSPFASLGELTVHVALPLETLQRVSQHLVYWKQARVVEVFRPDTRLAVAPGVDSSMDSPASLRFLEWQKRHKFKPLDLSLAKVICAFRGGRTLKHVQEELGSGGTDVGKILEWMLAEGMVLQLASYLHFLPARALRRTGGAPSGVVVGEELRQRLHPGLSDAELHLLAGRCKDEKELLFLGRLALEFARAHVRTDGSGFAALAAGFGLCQAEAEDLIRRNSDIFLPYVSYC